jgi:hypothetical protein
MELSLRANALMRVLAGLGTFFGDFVEHSFAETSFHARLRGTTK